MHRLRFSGGSSSRNGSKNGSSARSGSWSVSERSSRRVSISEDSGEHSSTAAKADPAKTLEQLMSPLKQEGRLAADVVAPTVLPAKEEPSVPLTPVAQYRQADKRFHSCMQQFERDTKASERARKRRDAVAAELEAAEAKLSEHDANLGSSRKALSLAVAEVSAAQQAFEADLTVQSQKAGKDESTGDGVRAAAHGRDSPGEDAVGGPKLKKQRTDEPSKEEKIWESFKGFCNGEITEGKVPSEAFIFRAQELFQGSKPSSQRSRTSTCRRKRGLQAARRLAVLIAVSMGLSITGFTLPQEGKPARLASFPNLSPASSQPMRLARRQRRWEPCWSPQSRPPLSGRCPSVLLPSVGEELDTPPTMSAGERRSGTFTRLPRRTAGGIVQHPDCDVASSASDAVGSVAFNSTQSPRRRPCRRGQRSLSPFVFYFANVSELGQKAMQWAMSLAAQAWFVVESH